MFYCSTMNTEEQVVSMPDESMLNGADIVSDNGCAIKDSSHDASGDMNDMALVKTNVHSASEDLLDADMKCESDTCHVNGDMTIHDEPGDNMLPVCDNVTLTKTLFTTDFQSSNIQENTQSKENEQIIVNASDEIASNEVKGNCEIHNEGCKKIEELEDKMNTNFFLEIEDEKIPILIEGSAETPKVHSDALNSTVSDTSLLEISEDQINEFDVNGIQETNHKIATSAVVYSEKDQICIAPLSNESETSSDKLEPTVLEVDNSNVVECLTASVSDSSSHLKENDLNKECDACPANIIKAGTTNLVTDEKDCQLDCYETVKQNDCDIEKKEDKKESSTITLPKSLSKGQKLDQLLSKITHKAESDTQSSTCIPKQAKARKSFVQSSNVNVSSPPPLSLPTNIPMTCLTFNVKELEKQGVLDVPKPSKRKAFEPIKITPYKEKYANLSPVLSPVKSPSKSVNPLIKNKLTRNKRKRAKRSGVYRLPGEKNFKKLYKNRKKDSEERQLNQEQQEKSTSVNNMNEVTSEAQNKVDKKGITEKLAEKDFANNEADLIMLDERKSFPREDNEINVCTVSKSLAMQPMQKNALDIVTQNSRLAFASSSASKKAKKSVQHGIDPSTNKTLDSFLKAGSHSQQIANKRKVQECVNNQSYESIELVCNEQQNRKAKDALKAALAAKGFADNSLAGPEEKKRKIEGSLSPAPPQMITLLPAGSVPLNLTSAIIPSTIAGAGHQIIFTPCSTAGAQTLIQNGTLNGLPMFQLVNSQTVSSPQTAQFVAIAQSPHSQGQALLMNNSQRTTLIQPKGMPLILTPFHVPTSSTSCSQPQVISSQTSLMNSMQNTSFRNQLNPVSTVMPSPSPHHKLSNSVLKNSLTQPRMQLPNGQYLDMKHVSHKDAHVLNGLYPVTPPQTPEEQRSYGGSHDSTADKTETASERPVSPDRDNIPLCTCKISGASFQKMSTAITFCQALDSVDGKVLGCCNKVTNPQLVRPAVKIPFLAVCENHRKRLRLHQCCPGCGHFCTQGKFLQCKKDGRNFIHHFHEPCQVSKDGKNYCPHCGELSTHYEIQLTMCDNSRSSVPKEIKPKKNQTKARIGLLDRRSAGSGEDTGDECAVSHVQEKSKKLVSTNDFLVGPDRYSLERVLSSLTQERPKKFRHLPKCLYTPAYDNDLERVVYMLEDGHNPNEKYEDLEGQSALHAAAAVGSLAIVHVLIQAGASPHVQDLSLKTPLMFAAEMNHPDVVSYLIKANAIIDTKADDGMTALHFAAKAGHVNIIKILLDTDSVKIDIKDDGGWTPLIWAAEHQQVDAVKLLLQRNADPNLRDNEENTTMHWAAFSGSVAIAELLLAAGCDLDSLNMHGDRPLHIAARQDHYECVVLFLARGADVEAKNNKGETPLECCLDQNSAVFLALKVNKQLKSFGVKHMGKPERLLHRDLSKGRENIPIPCVNGVDEEGIPTDYLYVTDNIETQFLKINRVIISLQSCQCKDDCSSMYCACGKNSLRCWYDKYGRLAPDFNMQEPPLIFECNRACECWTTCNNRVVQNGVMSRLQVFKTNSRGWGCKTLVDIPRGTFICEYIGEHISDSEADRREDDSYLFDLDNKDGETFCIDARRYGNVARFINHLCQPNLVPVKVFVDYQDLRFPRICLFASQDISAQEELGFDYGDRFWIIKWKQFTCTCDSQKCRYSKDTIQQTLEEYRQRHEIDTQEMQE